MNDNKNFVWRMLSDEQGNPSSKRVSGFMILIFTMTIFAFNPAMQLEFLLTWLGSALVALGISSFEKMTQYIGGSKKKDA